MSHRKLFICWIICSRGKRKRTASGAEVAENSGTAQKAVAQEISEPKGAFYHCNYCNKDISGKIRIKCVVCPDFDLCIECFSVGAEFTPHKCNHPYRVIVSPPLHFQSCFLSDIFDQLKLLEEILNF